MEHINIVRIVAILALTLLLSACKEPIQNPENLDPIYKELGVEAKAAEAEAKVEEETIAALKTELKGLEPRDLGRTSLRNELTLREKRLVQLRQRALYYQIRQQQRLEHDRIEYLKAFQADKPWPNPSEIAEYRTLKKLREAPRSWDKRVPKSDRYSKKAHREGPATADSAKQGKESSEKEEKKPEK